MKQAVRELHFEVRAEEEGRQLREVIQAHLQLVPYDLKKARRRTPRGIVVDGEELPLWKAVRAGSRVTVRLEEEYQGNIVPTPGPLDILYEDEDLLAVNKPPGLTVHPSQDFPDNSLGNYVEAHFLAEGEPHVLRSIGRLDMDTSGVILFGKNRTACAHLRAQDLDGRRRKTYAALVQGVPAPAEGTIDAPIARLPHDLIRRCVRPDGQRAVTHYRVCASWETYSLLEITLETGRTHQIRVHLAHIGHPLLGDPLYGTGRGIRPARGGEPIGRTALHARTMRFFLPFAEEREIALTAPLPADMARYLP